MTPRANRRPAGRVGPTRRLHVVRVAAEIALARLSFLSFGSSTSAFRVVGFACVGPSVPFRKRGRGRNTALRLAASSRVGYGLSYPTTNPVGCWSLGSAYEDRRSVGCEGLFVSLVGPLDVKAPRADAEPGNRGVVPGVDVLAKDLGVAALVVQRQETHDDNPV